MVNFSSWSNAVAIQLCARSLPYRWDVLLSFVSAQVCVVIIRLFHSYTQVEDTSVSLFTSPSTTCCTWRYVPPAYLNVFLRFCRIVMRMCVGRSSKDCAKITHKYTEAFANIGQKSWTRKACSILCRNTSNPMSTKLLVKVFWFWYVIRRWNHDFRHVPSPPTTFQVVPWIFSHRTI